MIYKSKFWQAGLAWGNALVVAILFSIVMCAGARASTLKFATDKPYTGTWESVFDVEGGLVVQMQELSTNKFEFEFKLSGSEILTSSCFILCNSGSYTLSFTLSDDNSQLSVSYSQPRFFLHWFESDVTLKGPLKWYSSDSWKATLKSNNLTLKLKVTADAISGKYDYDDWGEDSGTFYLSQ
jgi:hypothetical protein